MKAADRSGASRRRRRRPRPGRGRGPAQGHAHRRAARRPGRRAVREAACECGGVMEQRPLGRTGADVSVIGLGTWQLGGDWGDVDDDAAADVLDAALDAGVTLLDTADVYGDGRSEVRSARRWPRARTGRSSRPRPAAAPTRSRRPSTPGNLRAWIDRSRRNLGVDTLDLVQLHCPPPASTRPAGLRHPRRARGRGGDRGLRRLGGDRRRGPDRAAAPGRAVASRSSSTSSGASRWRSCCRPRAAGVGILARVPLASGLLTGKYDESTTFPADDHRNFNRHGEAFDVGETFAGVPFDVGVAAAREVAEIAGPASRPPPSPCAGSSTSPASPPSSPAPATTQVRGNVAAATAPSPTPSSPISSACTTSASAPTSTTAGNPPERLLSCCTHDAGTLRASDAGSTVTLAGWVAAAHGGVVFLDLRDASGYVQVVVREEAHHLRNEYCVLVTGEVRRRPEGNENPELPTGEIEVAVARRPPRCPSRSRPTRRPPTTSATSTATSTCGGRVRRGAAGALGDQPGRPRGDAPARLRRGGDAEPDPLHARGCARLRRPRRCSPASGTPCRSRRSCSSSC